MEKSTIVLGCLLAIGAIAQPSTNTPKNQSISLVEKLHYQIHSEDFNKTLSKTEQLEEFKGSTPGPNGWGNYNYNEIQYGVDGSNMVYVKNWDSQTSSWQATERKQQKTHNVTGAKTEATNWTYLNGAYQLANKTLYVRDASGHQSDYYYLIYNGSTYDTVLWVVPFYDAQGVDTLWQLRIPQGGQWLKTENHSYTYDSYGNLTQVLVKEWDASQTSLTNKAKDDRTVNTNGQIDEKLTYTWNSNSSSWVNDSKATYTYSANGDPLEETYYSNATGSWKESWKYNYTYDTQSLVADILHPVDYYYPDFSNKIVSKPLGYTVRQKNGANWDSAFSAVYVYNNYSVSVEEHHVIPAKIYPNPVANRLFIESTENLDHAIFKLFTLQGKLVDIKQIDNSNVNLSDLESGIYIYTVEENNLTIHHGKLK
jgi:hypothetical protein